MIEEEEHVAEQIQRLLGQRKPLLVMYSLLRVRMSCDVQLRPRSLERMSALHDRA